jgi:hypothetical protein
MDRRGKVELFEQLRLGHAAGETIRSLAKEHGIHRRMVRQAIFSAGEPTVRRYIGIRRRELGLKGVKVFVPQSQAAFGDHCGLSPPLQAAVRS